MKNLQIDDVKQTSSAWQANSLCEEQLHLGNADLPTVYNRKEGIMSPSENKECTSLRSGIYPPASALRIQ